MIIQGFIRQNAARSGKKILGLTPEAMQKMMQYDWPGNVRELRNAIEYAFVLCPSGGIGAQHLPPKIIGAERAEVVCPQVSAPVPQVAGTDEKENLVKVLLKTNGNQSEAARMLGVSRVTVWKWIKKHGIDVKKEILG